MTDTSPHPQNTPPIYDDDRLLAFALELDDDPELARALEDDETLRDRLRAIRDDLRAVHDGLQTIASPPEREPIDLASPHWAPLRRQLVPAPRRTRLRLRLNALVPALSLALALVAAGAVLVHETMQRPVVKSTTAAANSVATDEITAERKELASEAIVSPTSPTASVDTRPILALARRVDAAGKFRLVLTATAQRANGSTQPFLITSSLRGSASGLLRLTISERPAPKNESYLLLLKPSRPASAISSAMSTAIEQLSGNPSPNPTASPTSVNTPITVYSYAGTIAIVIALPPGVNPATVELP